MQDEATLALIEVHLRSNTNFRGAPASIDACKQQHIIRPAQQHLAYFKHTPPCRFDMVLMEDPEGNKVPWLKNAFDA